MKSFKQESHFDLENKMKTLIALALLTASLSANAFEHHSDPSLELRRELLPYNVTPPITGTRYQQERQQIELQRESNHIARERLEHERSHDAEMDYRRRTGYWN